MSEQLRHTHESGHEKIDEDFYEEHRKSLEEARKRAGEAAEKQDSGSIENILHTIEKEAATTKELEVKQHNAEHKPSDKPLFHDHHLRQHGYRQTMKKVQKQLPARQRTFSKFIHNPAVERASSVGGETIARPSGLLWGGVFSVITNLLVIMFCRYYGYEYNYLIGIVSFIGGFCFGLLLEFVLRGTRSKKSR